jgi:hypothetical protein
MAALRIKLYFDVNKKWADSQEIDFKKTKKIFLAERNSF